MQYGSGTMGSEETWLFMRRVSSEMELQKSRFQFAKAGKVAFPSVTMAGIVALWLTIVPPADAEQRVHWCWDAGSSRYTNASAERTRGKQVEKGGASGPTLELDSPPPDPRVPPPHTHIQKKKRM